VKKIYFSSVVINYIYSKYAAGSQTISIPDRQKFLEQHRECWDTPCYAIHRIQTHKVIEFARAALHSLHVFFQPAQL
jgi:hypothetical protein